MRDSETVRRAVGSALVALTGVAGAVTSVVVAPTDSARVTAAVQAVVIGAYIAVGLLILARHPGHRVGWLALVGAATWGAGEAVLDVAVNQIRDDPEDRLAALAGTIGSALRGLGWLALVLLLPLLFPDGERAGSPWVRRWAWRGAYTVVGALTAAAILVPTSEDDRLRTIDNPIGLPASLAVVTDLVALAAFTTGVLTVALAVVTLVQRWRGDDALVRQQLLWFAMAFACPAVLFPLGLASQASPWMFGAATLPVPIAITVAVLQHRLYDIQLVVNRSLTFAGLSVLIAGLYAVVVGGVGAMLRVQGASWLPWVGAGVVAVSFAPLRNALQQAANKLTYGQWAQPAEVLAGTGRRLADATDVRALLQSLTDDLTTGLRLARAEILDATGQPLAASGTSKGRLDAIPLTAYGVQVGALRHSGDRLRPSDRALLADLARQLGSVVHSATLLDALRASQERLVLAREEERRRLRRDLHDGLGPALAALTLRVDTLRNRSAERGSELDAALLDVRAGIQDTVRDVRRIVEGLRPPALDELGLNAALRHLADRLAADTGLAVTVEVPDLPPVPAAVEVAAYRVAQEALTNVVRHAHAGHVRIQVALNGDGLVLEVLDDGTGTAAPRPGGVGLGSMHERARELGGSLTVASRSETGTMVRALLPLTAAGTT